MCPTSKGSGLTILAGVTRRARRTLSPAPVRPILVFQSDDWGRVGAPSPECLDRLRQAGLPVGRSAWDYYGLESGSDLLRLAEVLEAFCDNEGRSPCFTANFVLANADLHAMAAEDYKRFCWKPVREGFPDPWSDDLLPIYREVIARNVFSPGLHGFTHFNMSVFLRSLAENSELGERARLLANQDVPYLASCTPEFNFALVERSGGREIFLDRGRQLAWIEAGMKLFETTFGFPAVTTCAPGYRADRASLEIWRSLGIRVVEQIGSGDIISTGGLIHLQRNIFLEPCLSSGDVVETAVRQAIAAVRQGYPMIVCTHSINYISRHLAKAEHGRSALKLFLEKIMGLFPDVRFATDADLVDAVGGSLREWLRVPNATELCARSI